MIDPSGNEDLPRSHWLVGLIFWTWFLLGLVVLAWFNLAHAAAVYRPAWTGSGTVGMLLTAFLRPGYVWVWFRTIVWDGLFAGHAIAWPFWYLVGRALRHAPSAGLWTWSYRVAYAFAHALGSPPVYMGVMWNLALLLIAVWLPPLLVARRMASSRSVEARLGTAHWPAPKILRPYTRAAGRLGSLPLGRVIGSRPGAGCDLALPLRDPGINVGRFSHAAIWGVSEAGKTSAVFKPWLWTDLFLNDPSQVDRDGWPIAAMSHVVIDMKHPDMYADLAPYAAVLPRRLLLLAPGDPDRSLHYNPLDFVRVGAGSPGAVDDIAALADAIILNTPMGYKDDQFHQGRERDLLQLLIWYVCDVQEAIDRGQPEVADVYQELIELVRPVLPPATPMPPQRSFPMVAALVHLDGQKLLGVIQQTVTDPAHPENWRVRWEQFAAKAKRSDDFTDWLGGLRRRLAVFTSPGVAAISDRSDFSLDLVGRQPSTLIIGMPRELTKALEPYSALIITQLLQQLKRVAAGSPTRRLPVPATIYLDELPAQGRIPLLEHEVATLRDMAVCFVCGMQSTAALEAKYEPRIAASITSNTNTKIVIGRNLGLEDAKYFSQLAGETTILTPATSESVRGGGRSIRTARRALITPDQIHRMPQFEALVFLQTGHHTQTRLRPFHEAKHERAEIRQDPRFAAGGHTPEGIRVLPVVYLRHRQTELDALLGPWETELRPRPVPLPAESEAGDTEATLLVEHAAASESSAADTGAASPDGEQGNATTPPVETAEEAVGGEPTSAPQGSGIQVGHDATPSALPASDQGAVSDLAGFFNTLQRRRITNGQVEPGAAPGWWVQLPGGDHVLARWAYVRSFGELRHTKARDIADRWQRAGFVIPRRLSVPDPAGAVSVLAFTPDAIRRLTPAVTDVLAGWPRLSPRDLQGFELAPPTSDPSPPLAQPAERTQNGHGDPLRVVVDWARAHRAGLESSTSHEHGQWEVVVQGESVLLIRQPSLNRMLMQQKLDLRTIMMTWRETGVIMAEDKRFTVHTRALNQNHQGARFVAFRWDRLEAAGLRRGIGSGHGS